MDRLRSIEIENFRSIEKLKFDVDALQVLIGENGGGKSSLIECFEILRRAAAPQFAQEIERVHGGTRALLRHGSGECKLTATVTLFDGAESADYSISFGGQAGWGIALRDEQLTHTTSAGKRVLFKRSDGRAIIRPPDEAGLQFPDGSNLELALPFVRTHAIAGRVWSVLESIEVHLGHEVGALWRQRERSRAGSSGSLSGTLREPSQLSPGRRLEHGATNLASVFHSLRNDASPAEWALTRKLVRLGLGDDVEDVAVQVVADSGYATLTVRYIDGRIVPAMALSDGQLAFLAFVAMTRTSAPRSVLLVDEPELHLHPGLAVRVLDLLDAAAARSPVIIATHSSDILDALERPESQVRIVSQIDGKTLSGRLSPGFLERWQPKTLSEIRRSIGDAELRGHL